MQKKKRNEIGCKICLRSNQISALWRYSACVQICVSVRLTVQAPDLCRRQQTSAPLSFAVALASVRVRITAICFGQLR